MISDAPVTDDEGAGVLRYEHRRGEAGRRLYHVRETASTEMWTVCVYLQQLAPVVCDKVGFIISWQPADKLARCQWIKVFFCCFFFIFLVFTWLFSCPSWIKSVVGSDLREANSALLAGDSQFLLCLQVTRLGLSLLFSTSLTWAGGSGCLDSHKRLILLSVLQ